jgi:carboxyl-terminal processing protease
MKKTIARSLVLCGWSALAVLVLALLPVSARSGGAKPKTGLTEEQQKLNLESFKVVWETVRDHHWDPKLGGLDWQAVHDEFKPKIEMAKTQKEVRALLNDMLGRLKQSHFGIIPNDVYDEVTGGTKENPQAKGVPGFDVRVLDGAAIVFRVEAGMPAEKQGVKPGWEVVKIAGEEMAPVLAKVAKALKDSQSLERQLAMTVIRKLGGKEGDKLDIVFRDGKDQELKLTIPLMRPKGTATKLGNLPTVFVDFESRKLEKGAAYFRLNTFFDPSVVMPAFEKVVLGNLKADGFVFDIRGNPGGIGGMAMGIASWFINKPGQKLGTMITRIGELNFILNQRPETFGGPLVILVDGLSASTSEILAGGLKDLKRAAIIGTKTMGAALPSVVVRLPNKDGFQYAIANYISVGGKALEGNGVVPDVEVKLTRQALLAGQDPALDAAMSWIQEQNKKSGAGK